MLLQHCDRHQHSHSGTVTEAQKHNATVTITVFIAESGRAPSAGSPSLSHTTEEPSLRLPEQDSQPLHTPPSVTSQRWEFFFNGTSYALGTGPWGTLGYHGALTFWMGLVPNHNTGQD